MSNFELTLPSPILAFSVGNSNFTHTDFTIFKINILIGIVIKKRICASCMRGELGFFPDRYKSEHQVEKYQEHFHKTRKQVVIALDGTLFRQILCIFRAFQRID